MIDENGKHLNSRDMAEVILKLVDDFKKDHPLFLGVKVIMAILRTYDQNDFDEKIERFLDLRKKYPDLVVGFDLVGQEDFGRPLASYVDKLKDISDNGRFFFHAGGLYCI